ncbi:hypothetical protein TRVA0_021S01398 [Trichomonascus vanleenenianus]|uniref:uncharacterized protein n=1 Tax=Trichomonascus vanleenenianus TaxID=2268995 RepID=UPI003ECA919E
MGQSSSQRAYWLLALAFVTLYLFKSSTTHPEPSSRSMKFLELDKTSREVPWGTSYSPYTSAGGCKAIKEIERDLRVIASTGIKTVRLFSGDCGVMEARSDLQAIVGIHPYVTDASTVGEKRYAQLLESVDNQLADLEPHLERAQMVVVGSQGVFEEEYTQADLVRLIKHARRHLSTHGSFTGLITTSEPLTSWVSATKYNANDIDEYRRFREEKLVSSDLMIDSGVKTAEFDDLCAVVDVIGLVVQPFFDSRVLADQAGQVVSRDVKFANYVCSDEFIGRAHFNRHSDDESPGEDSKPVVVLEAGWPHDGEDNGNAVATPEAQQEAIESILDARFGEKAIPAVIYSFFDEQWRNPGRLGVETSFGLKH